MPYALRKKGNQYCVYNKDTGENKGCSSSREMGLRHMRALYAHAGGKELDSSDTCGCDVCMCLDQYDNLEEVAIEDIIDSKGIADSILGYMKKAIGLDSGEDSEPKTTVTVTKDAEGHRRVTMAVSNTLKDRHGEIITEEAHKEYVAYVKETSDYPEFWLWHKPLVWGQADSVSYNEELKVLSVSGLAKDGYEYVADALAVNSQKDIGVSHGFKGWGRPGYVDWYRMKECSPLPRSEAANVWTGVLGEEVMLTDKQKKFFSGLGVPDAMIEDISSRNKDFALAAKEAGLSVVEEPEPKPDESKPDEPKPEAVKAITVTASGDAPAWATQIIDGFNKMNERLAGVETKQKELEDKSKDYVASALEAAIQPGRTGFEASKQGEPPSESERAEVKNWGDSELAELIMGGIK